MKFSVITPCYNSEKYIRYTIESVIFQEGNFEIEYLLVDGLSNDNTIKIIEEYINKLKNNEIKIKCKNIELKYISKKDNSMYEALVTGFKNISGDIISYINSDDIYLPNSFKCINEVFKNNKVNWLTGRNTIINWQGIIVENFLPLRYKNKFIINGIYSQKLPAIQQESTFWKKELLNLVDMKELMSFKLAGDAYLWSCFAKEYNLDIVNASIAAFRTSSNQLTSNIDKYKHELNKNILNKRTFTIEVFFEKIIWKFPNKIKFLINKNIINLKMRG